MRIRDMGGLSDAESPTDSAELWIFEIGALLRKLWLKNVGILVSSNGSWWRVITLGKLCKQTVNGTTNKQAKHKIINENEGHKQTQQGLIQQLCFSSNQHKKVYNEKIKQWNTVN